MAWHATRNINSYRPSYEMHMRAPFKAHYLWMVVQITRWLCTTDHWCIVQANRTYYFVVVHIQWRLVAWHSNCICAHISYSLMDMVNEHTLTRDLYRILANNFVRFICRFSIVHICKFCSLRATDTGLLSLDITVTFSKWPQTECYTMMITTMLLRFLCLILCGTATTTVSSPCNSHANNQNDQLIDRNGGKEKKKGRMFWPLCAHG